MSDSRTLAWFEGDFLLLPVSVFFQMVATRCEVLGDRTSHLTGKNIYMSQANIRAMHADFEFALIIHE